MNTVKTGPEKCRRGRRGPLNVQLELKGMRGMSILESSIDGGGSDERVQAPEAAQDSFLLYFGGNELLLEQLPGSESMRQFGSHFCALGQVT